MRSRRTPARRRWRALLTLARERRFVDLIPELPVGPDERATATLLQSIAAYALGDTARALSVQLRRALEAGGRHGALADEWRDFATSSLSAVP